MKISSIVLLFTIFTLNSAFAQVNFEWAKKMGGGAHEQGWDICIDSYGNVYSVGTFQSDSVDFDPGPGVFNLFLNGSSGGPTTESFLQKLDSNGNLIWAKKFETQSPFSVAAYEVSLDNFGNIYVAGIFNGITDFDPGPGIFNLTPNGDHDAFILKLNNNGNFLWAKKIGGTANDVIYSITIDNSNNLLCTGYFKGTCDFDPSSSVFNLTSSGDFDVFINKLDSDGNFIWAKRVGGIASDQGTDIVTDNMGNSYVTGEYFSSNVDFNPGSGIYNLTNTGSCDAFILKLDISGNFVWAKKVGGTGIDRSRAITIDNNQNIILSGSFQATVDFDPGVNSFTLNAFGNSDLFVEKFDLNGSFLWARQIGGSNSYGQPNCIITDANNNIYITGNSLGVIDFDPGIGVFNLSTGTSAAKFYAKLNSLGNFEWAYNLSTSQSDGKAICVNSFGDVYTIGHFIGLTDFNPGYATFLMSSASGGKYDIFIQKISQCVLTTNLNIFSCNTFALNNQTYTQSGTYTQLLTNAQGCDSTITLNLTITQPTTHTITQTACSSFSLNNQNYTQSGTYTQLLTNAQGCDSTITLNLNITQPTAHTVTQTACSSFSLNNQTYTQSGTYTQLLTNAQGCDSTITLNLNITQPTAHTITQTACSSFSLNNQNYTQSGTYTQLLTNAQGCDSTITLNLTITQPTAHTINQTACSSFSLNNQTYTQSGTYTQLLTNSQGCDSTITLNLNIIQPTAHTITQTACSSFSINNQTYMQSGTYTQLLTNSQGCDSTITLNLTITQPTAHTITQTGCSSFSLNNQTYTQSGTYTQQLTNAQGCDSTITLNLTIIQPASDTIVQTACSSFSLNDQNYTQSGIYTQQLTNEQGCDSTITLILTINQPSNSNISQSATDSYTWPVNGQTYTQSGVYTAVIPNAAGCDSTITLNLTLDYTGINDVETTDFNVYPNPTTGTLFIQIQNELINEKFVIVDCWGRIVLDGKLTQITNSFDITGFSSGSYFIKVQGSPHVIQFYKL